MTKYIAWDFDGTLAERPGMWSAAVSEAAAIEGILVDADDLKPHLLRGFPWHAPDFVRLGTESADEWWMRLEALFSAILSNHFGLDHDLASRISKRVRSVYCNPESWRVFDDVRSTLDGLSESGWRHVILSNHIPELAELVRALDLGLFFDAIFTSGRTGAEKPNPAAFQILRNYTEAASRTIMVGDSWRADICGAMSFGIEAVLVRNIHPDSPWCCSNLRELQVLLSHEERNDA